ncbi:ROK family protein [Thermomonas sp. HDW16]|uniref:ROK family protein n=1 Tax=Thermomonas sp. HDW16 TaxID=2714945 RepID=UPI00140BA7FC|nr:ROK family protein [Thermomonas sp. HDW16]QIL21560.1 ROK family protein [Thermomonas sp. HDW16]
MAEHNATSGICYGIDIGGSKIELVACDASLQIVHRQRIDTPQHDYGAFLDAVQALVANADATTGAFCESIGIGLPGVRDRATGRQLSANVPALTGKHVGSDLQARLQRPLQLGNDLQCFALSEAHGGAAEGYPSMYGAILGTGAGGGYCVEGRLVAGGNGIAGEWGHWTIPATLLAKYDLPLLDCGCGLRGCVERYVSGSGMAALHRHLGGASAAAATTIAAAQAGDATAQRALDIHLDLLGHAFASLVMVVDPHVIVIGGGLSKYEALYSALPAAIETHLFRGVRVPPILPPKFGDAGGARGAALLARQAH